MTIAILRHRLYRHRRHHQPRCGLRPALGRVHGRVRGHRARHRHVVGHQGGPVLTIAAAVTIALLFGPLRRRAQLFANRLVYGKRATPYQALSDFAGDMAGQLDLDRGRRPDGVGPGRCDRGRPGRGMDPGRYGAAPGRDLAARVTPIHRRRARRRRRASCLRGGIARGSCQAWRRAAWRIVPAKAQE